MQILDGNTISQKILDQLKTELNNAKSLPRLDIILVGDDSASHKYVEMKQKKAQEIGINSQVHFLDKNLNTQNVIDLINQLNQNPEVTALMVQLPLPKNIDTKLVLEAIDPNKDADGLSPINLGLLFHNSPKAIAPATAIGIIKLLAAYNIDLSGKNAVILGRSTEVGLPLISLLLKQNATVTVCHSYTQNLENITRGADILISAIAKGGFITDKYIKPDAIVVDVGLSPDSNNKLIGDVDYQSIVSKAGFITPVPGGVGPMTIASLLSNTIDILKRNNL